MGKNVLILHGTMGSPRGNWFQWLKQQLETNGYKVWVPRLPKSDKPRVTRNMKYIFANKKWRFGSDSILIGHSSGPATIFGLLSELPKETVVNNCILVAPIIRSDWEPNSELFDYKYDFAKIRKKSKKFVILHSETDPYVSLDQPRYLANKLNAKLIIKKNEGHFNLEKSPDYNKFPLILSLVN